MDVSTESVLKHKLSCQECIQSGLVFLLLLRGITGQVLKSILIKDLPQASSTCLNGALCWKCECPQLVIIFADIHQYAWCATIRYVLDSHNAFHYFWVDGLKPDLYFCNTLSNSMLFQNKKGQRHPILLRKCCSTSWNLEGARSKQHLTQRKPVCVNKLTL